MRAKLMTMYVSATLLIGITLALSVAAIFSEGYSRGWLLIPAALFAGLGRKIRKMQS